MLLDESDAVGLLPLKYPPHRCHIIAARLNASATFSGKESIDSFLQIALCGLQGFAWHGD